MEINEINETTGIYTLQKVAAELSISFHTVETHRKNLMGKLGVNSIISMTRMATEYRLL